MGILKKLFGRPSDVAKELPQIEKDKVLVYPMIKDASWQGMPYVVLLPFVSWDETSDLAIVFAQDAGDRFEYITKADIEDEAIKENFNKWQQNIDAYPFEFEMPEMYDKRMIITNEIDHSAEKILSPAFLTAACKALNTDKLIISAPRRRCLALTSYYEDFLMLESFLYIHFCTWAEESSGNEAITEMIFVAGADKVQYAVPLGFRMNLYEKDGQRKLVYSSMGDLFDENDQINFQSIIERRKIPISFPG